MARGAQGAGVKMTRAQYLTERGWTSQSDQDGWWRDPAAARQSGIDGFLVDPNNAITIQLARDAEKEREAWVAFAAALLSTADSQGMWTGTDAEQVGVTADATFDQYRARFAVEFTDEASK